MSLKKKTHKFFQLFKNFVILLRHILRFSLTLIRHYCSLSWEVTYYSWLVLGQAGTGLLGYTLPHHKNNQLKNQTAGIWAADQTRSSPWHSRQAGACGDPSSNCH